MAENMGLLVAIAVVAVHFLAVGVFPRFSHDISDGILRIRRHIFRWIPFGTRKIRIDDIESVELSGLGKVPCRAMEWGRLFALEGVLLTLRKRYSLFYRAIYITPRDPRGFIRELEPLLAPTTPGVGVKRRRVRLPPPLWVTDLIVAMSAVCWGAAVALIMTYEQMQIAFHPLHGIVLGIAGALLAVPTWMWMWMDCLRELADRKRVRLALWLASMTFVCPLAPLYYLLEWRPRRRAAPG